MLRSTFVGFGLRTAIFSAMIGLTVVIVHPVSCYGFGDVPALPTAPIANEVKIAAALDERTELDFADQPLSDAIEFLRQRHQIEIQLDHKALSDAGVATDTPITRNIKGITLESALDLMFSQLELAWVIHDEVLLVTSKAQADKMIDTRVYPVRDLLTMAGDELDPGLGMDYDALIECLSEVAAGGDATPAPRSIRVYRPAQALVITSPILDHYRIEKLLKALRQAKADVPPR
jgi:hypothetical protein